MCIYSIYHVIDYGVLISCSIGLCCTPIPEICHFNFLVAPDWLDSWAAPYTSILATIMSSEYLASHVPILTRVKRLSGIFVPVLR